MSCQLVKKHGHQGLGMFHPLFPKCKLKQLLSDFEVLSHNHVFGDRLPTTSLFVESVNNLIYTFLLSNVCNGDLSKNDLVLGLNNLKKYFGERIKSIMYRIFEYSIIPPISPLHTSIPQSCLQKTHYYHLKLNSTTNPLPKYKTFL